MNDNQSNIDVVNVDKCSSVKDYDSGLVVASTCRYDSMAINEDTTSGIFIDHMLAQDMGITPALSQVSFLIN